MLALDQLADQRRRRRGPGEGGNGVDVRLDPFGACLGAGDRVQADPRAEVDQLQRAVHRPTDRGARSPPTPGDPTGLVLDRGDLVRCGVGVQRIRAGRLGDRGGRPDQPGLLLDEGAATADPLLPRRPLGEHRSRVGIWQRQRESGRVVGGGRDWLAQPSLGDGRIEIGADGLHRRVEERTERRARSLGGFVMGTDHETVASSGRADVQQPDPLGAVHLLLGRAEIVVAERGQVLREPHLGIVVRPQDRRSATAGRDSQPEECHHRELQPFRPVDGHDTHSRIVIFGQHRGGDPHRVGGLELDPSQERGQVAALALDEGLRLVREKAQAAPPVASTPGQRRELEHPVVGQQPVHESVRTEPPSVVVETRQRRQRLGHRMVRRERRMIGEQVAPAPSRRPPFEQVGVRTGEHRRAQRGNEVDLVAGVVDRPEDRHHLPHLLRRPDERGRE